MAASAGWYDDGSGRQRWWDGTQWRAFLDEGADTMAGPSRDVSVVHSAAATATTEDDVQVAPPRAVSNHQGYFYHTELLSMTEKIMGRIGSGSHSASSHIGDRLSELSAQGWEFVTTTRVPVVGKVFKSEDHRTLTVAIFRRPR